MSATLTYPTVAEAAQALLALPPDSWASRDADFYRAADALAVALVGAEYGIYPPYRDHEYDRRTGRPAYRRYLKLLNEFLRGEERAIRTRCQQYL